MKIRWTLVMAAAIAALAQPALAAQNITKRATVAADAAVDVSNVQGRVDVAAWDRNEVELTAVLESDKDELEYDATERLVRIKVTRPERSYRYHDDEDDAILTLRVPKGARLAVHTVSADIMVDGVRGPQDLGTVSGTLTTRAYDEAIEVRAVSGEITVTGSDGEAAVSFENVSGTTTVNGIRGSFEGRAVSGDILATVAAVDRLRVGSVTGDIGLQVELTPAARADLESVNGDITLTVKPPVNAEFEMETLNGDIGNCFGAKARAKSKYGPGSELTLTQGKGGAWVDIQTLNGDIEVCDR
ncbi:MAG TPA: DUF4097 family beta strand repeat-containing protein [Steroidobacteraceae bacterium]|jgi:hypothetical protein